MRTPFIHKLMHSVQMLPGFGARQSRNGIERAIERYNAEYAHAPARRGVAFVGFLGAVLVPLMAAKIALSGVCILTLWSLAVVRRPVNLMCDQGDRLIPDPLLGFLAEPGVLDDATRTRLGAAALTHAGLPVSTLRAEWGHLLASEAAAARRDTPGFRALTAGPQAREDIPPSSDPKTTIDLHGMLKQQCRDAVESEARSRTDQTSTHDRNRTDANGGS
jgi:hypothetical protein